MGTSALYAVHFCGRTVISIERAIVIWQSAKVENSIKNVKSSFAFCQVGLFQYFGKMVSDSSQKAMTFFDKILNSLPGFSDVFDEETFLAFAFVFVCMAFGVRQS